MSNLSKVTSTRDHAGPIVQGRQGRQFQQWVSSETRSVVWTGGQGGPRRAHQRVGARCTLPNCSAISTVLLLSQDLTVAASAGGCWVQRARANNDCIISTWFRHFSQFFVHQSLSKDNLITELPKFVQMLWFIGFGPTGVLAGSFAASWQSVQHWQCRRRKPFFRCLSVHYSICNYFEMDFCEY